MADVDPLEPMRRLVQRTKDHCDGILTTCAEIVLSATRITYGNEGDSMPVPKIQDTAEFLNYFMQAMPGLVIELIDGVDDPPIIMATDMLEKMFGYAPGELNGKPLSVVVPPDKREVHRSHIKGFSKHPVDRQMGNLGNVDPEGYTTDGQRFPIAVTWKRFFCEQRHFAAASVMPQVKISTKALP